MQSATQMDMGRASGKTIAGRENTTRLYLLRLGMFIKGLFAQCLLSVDNSAQPALLKITRIWPRCRSRTRRVFRQIPAHNLLPDGYDGTL